jgi:hypothetical protein
MPPVNLRDELRERVSNFKAPPGPLHAGTGGLRSVPNQKDDGAIVTGLIVGSTPAGTHPRPDPLVTGFGAEWPPLTSVIFVCDQLTQMGTSKSGATETHNAALAEYDR